MKNYDEVIESLVLKKDFAMLSASERSHVLRVLGSPEAYASLRALRTRTNQVLRAEPAPADPDGWKKVNAMAALPRRSGPAWWQAAAAVLLVAVLSWYLGSLGREQLPAETVLITQVDTLVKVVRVPDTVYLEAKRISHSPRSVKQPPLRAVATSPTPPSRELQAAVSALPEPSEVIRERESRAQLPGPSLNWGGFSDKMMRGERP